MAELPSSLTNKVILWGDSTVDINVDEPSGARKTNGLAFSGTITADEWNWMWYVQGLLLEHFRTVMIRAFDTLESAITTVSEGDVFRLVIPAQDFYTDVGDQTTQATSTYAVKKICSDGRRLYYAQLNAAAATIIYAVPADTGAPAKDWSSPSFTLVGELWRKLDTDGSLVAAALGGAIGGGELGLGVWDADDGALLFSVTAQTHRTCCCASSPTARRVFYADDAAPGTIKRWVEGSGSSTFATVIATSYIADIDYAAGVVAVLYVRNPGGGNARYLAVYDAATATLLDTHTLAGTAPASLTDYRGRVRYDGVHCWVLDTDAAAPSANPTIRRYSPIIGDASASVAADFALSLEFALGDDTGALTDDQFDMVVDDHFVWVFGEDYLFALDKTTGDVISRWDLTATATPNSVATCGRYVWSNVQIGQASGGYISAFPRPLTTGLWLRQGDGTTAASERRVTRRLAVPADGYGGAL